MTPCMLCAAGGFSFFMPRGIVLLLCHSSSLPLGCDALLRNTPPGEYTMEERCHSAADAGLQLHMRICAQGTCLREA